MQISWVSKSGWRLLMAVAGTFAIAPSTLAWDWNCHPDCEGEVPVTGECDSPSVWYWCHDGVEDSSFARTEQVSVAENQSTSLGSPAIVYVARPSNAIPPYNFEVRTNIGSVEATVEDYTNTSTTTYGIIAPPSLSVLPSGEAFVAFAELRSTATSVKVTVRKYKLEDGDWVPETPIWYGPELYSYNYGIGGFDVQIYDSTHWAFGGNFWTQASSTSKYNYNYRLSMNDGNGSKSVLYVNSSYSYEEDEPYLSGPVPFSYKVGNSASSPSTVVYNAATSYDSTSGSPIGEKLKAYSASTTSPYSVTLDSTIISQPIAYFALVTTNANKRHVIYQDAVTPNWNWLYCATSSAVGTWSTHQPYATQYWNYETIYGEPIAASADPTSSSDAFDVYLWAPANYDPNIASVLHHSSGTSYTVDTVITDTSSTLFRPGSKSIGTDGTGENVVSLYNSVHKSEIAINY